jgi:hypothetical protein
MLSCVLFVFTTVNKANRICLLSRSSRLCAGKNEDFPHLSAVQGMNAIVCGKGQNFLPCIDCGKIYRSKVKLGFHIGTHRRETSL